MQIPTVVGTNVYSCVCVQGCVHAGLYVCRDVYLQDCVCKACVCVSSGNVNAGRVCVHGCVVQGVWCVHRACVCTGCVLMPLHAAVKA